MAWDPEYHKDTLSNDEFIKILEKNNRVLSEVGFLAMKNYWFDADAYDIFSKNSTPLQVFSSEATTVNTDFICNKWLFEAAENGARLFFHLPFWFNLYVDTKSYIAKKMNQYLKEFTSYMDMYGFDYKVISHAEYPVSLPKSTPVVFVEDNFVHNVEAISKTILGSNCEFLIENQVSTFKFFDRRKDFNSLTMFDALLANSDIPNIGYCFDTEHAWAGGGEHKIYVPFIDKIKFVHFNSIPYYVDEGSQIDRHSYTRLSKCNGFGVEWLQQFFADTFGRIPYVLERRSKDVAIFDIETIAEWAGELPQRCRNTGVGTK